MSTTLAPVHVIVDDVVPFDAAILAGQLAPSSIDKYRCDFTAYLRFAGRGPRPRHLGPLACCAGR